MPDDHSCYVGVPVTHRKSQRTDEGVKDRYAKDIARGVVSILVRMPPELHQQIKAQAAREGRSMAETMRHALRLHVDAQKAAEDSQ